MYLSEFIDSCDERYQDVCLEVGVLPSSHLAKVAASYICELIYRDFDVFDFIELIYYENSLHDYGSGFDYCKKVSVNVSD